MTPKDSGHGTLADRIAQTKANELARETGPTHGTAGFHGTRPAPWADALRDPPAAAAPSEPEHPANHCWYDGPHGRQAALLLEWSEGGRVERRGRVAVACLEPDGHWSMVEMWVEQGMLSPAQGT